MQKDQKTSVQYLKVDSDYAGQRIDNFLVTKLKGVPKSRIYRILRKGEVRVNKKRIDPSYRLEDGDEIRIPPVRIEERPAVLPPSKQIVELLEDRILFENKYLMVINKPSGIPVHGGSGNSRGVIEILKSMYPKLPQLELAHRLDADTSGCLVIAKKRSALREIHELLRAGRVHKVYSALTKGHWNPSELLVTASLKKNFLASGERVVRVQDDGKDSVTQFRVEKEFQNATLVSATLLTGRTHQIRVHAQYRGHSLAGDDKYGDKDFNKAMRAYGLKRLFLHAKLVEFTMLSSGDKISVSAPLDSDLESCIKNMNKINE